MVAFQKLLNFLFGKRKGVSHFIPCQGIVGEDFFLLLILLAFGVKFIRSIKGIIGMPGSYEFFCKGFVDIFSF